MEVTMIINWILQEKAKVDLSLCYFSKELSLRFKDCEKKVVIEACCFIVRVRRFVAGVSMKETHIYLDVCVYLHACLAP